MTITRIEAAHLADLVSQFTSVLAEPDHDPAMERLSPSVYPDDALASAEFRDLTRGDLIDRRRADADLILAALRDADLSLDTEEVDNADALEEVVLTLSPSDAESWLRTLSAIRLVLASRLGITTEDDLDPEDPRFGIYEWVGYRLDGLVNAINE
nr:DUF2017 family protein [Microbacterium endophyticum]